MQVKRNDISETQVKLLITADEKFLESVKVHALNILGKKVKVPGFREGTAPLNLIEKNLDPTHLQNEFIEQAINTLYPEVIRSEGLRPVAEPQISLKKFVPFSQLEFEVAVEVVGKIQLPDYKKIKKAKKQVVISPKDINEVLKSLQVRLADRKEVDRPAKNGDEVIIDFKGTDNNGPVNGAEGTDYPLVLGSKTFIPGFEENLVGMKPGSDKSFKITFPADYGVKTLASKKVTFGVKVKKVNELKEPSLDDVFATKAGPFKKLADLKADIKKQLSLERQNEADREFQNQLLEEIADQTKVVVPKVLTDRQIMAGEQDERQNLAYKGQTWQEHLKEEGVTEEEHRERNRQTAEKTVKTSLALSEIAEREQIEVTPEELEIRIQVLKGQYQDASMRAELDKPENRQDIAGRLLTEKTIAKLVDYALKQ